MEENAGIQDFEQPEGVLDSIDLGDSQGSEAIPDPEVEDVSHETPSQPPKLVIKKMPNSAKDPLVKGTEFSFGGHDDQWVYRVYDIRSRGRKFVQRVGKVEIVEEPEGGEVQDG